MKWIVLCPLLAILVNSSTCKDISKKRSEPSLLEAECLAGSEWESNCHKCTCSDRGEATCIRQDTCPKEQEGLKPIRCKPKTSFKRSCNICTCLENGLGLCTLQACGVNVVEPIQAKPPSPVKAHIVPDKQCAPGSKWKSQCRDCECSEDGYSICSLTPCPGQEKEPILQCAPGTEWKNDCNACWCTSEGNAMCTRMGCISVANMNFGDEKPDSDKVEDIKDETKKEVTPEISNSSVRKIRAAPTTPAKVCQPLTEFRMDCNKCLCDNEGQAFSCTRMDCQAQNPNHTRKKREVSQVPVPKCDPGSVFDQDCNVCRCTSDGHHATCTLKRCINKPERDSEEIDEPLPESDPNFRCNPGEQFKRSCTDCTCSADGKSVFCTVRLCEKDLAPKL